MNGFNFSTTVRKVATIEHLVDGVMVVFALASIGNISEYMKGHGHNPVTAYGVGIALGLGLVAISIMLARTPTDDRRTFASMLAATLAVGLLSGTVQALAYYEHTGNIYTACLQGYGFPLIGECLLAVAMAMHTASERKRRARLADDGMEERINDAISEALANIDIGGMQSYIEKQAGLILKHKMAEIVSRRTGTSNTLPPTVDAEQGPSPLQSPEFNVSQTPDIDTVRAKALAAKRTIKAHRQEQLLSILLTEFNGQPADVLDKTALGKRLGATRQTIGRDIEEMQAQQRVSINGHVAVLG